ncbi:MAG: hypothetical protein HQK66_09450, partial [Desulfamplus sp.]|nr:hypothetical protein [Desulfamplus sp.]
TEGLEVQDDKAQAIKTEGLEVQDDKAQAIKTEGLEVQDDKTQAIEIIKTETDSIPEKEGMENIIKKPKNTAEDDKNKEENNVTDINIETEEGTQEHGDKKNLTLEKTSEIIEIKDPNAFIEELKKLSGQ